MLRSAGYRPHNATRAAPGAALFHVMHDQRGELGSLYRFPSQNRARISAERGRSRRPTAGAPRLVGAAPAIGRPRQPLARAAAIGRPRRLSAPRRHSAAAPAIRGPRRPIGGLAGHSAAAWAIRRRVSYSAARRRRGGWGAVCSSSSSSSSVSSAALTWRAPVVTCSSCGSSRPSVTAPWSANRRAAGSTRAS